MHKSVVHYLRHSIIKGDLVHPISINGFITNNDSGMDEDVLYTIEMRDVSNYGRSKKNELPTDIQTMQSLHPFELVPWRPLLKMLWIASEEREKLRAVLPISVYASANVDFPS